MGKKKQSDKLGLHLSIAALVIAVFSCLTAVGALSLAIVAYVQTDRPHTLFEESYARLDLLDKKIGRAESYIQRWREVEDITPGADLALYELNLAQARTLRDEAESSLMRYECEQTNSYILQADELASSVPAYLPPPGAQPAWAWVLFVLAGTLAMSLVGFVVHMIWRRRSSKPPAEDPRP